MVGAEAVDLGVGNGEIVSCMYDNEYAYQCLLLVILTREGILPSLASWLEVIRHDADTNAIPFTSPKYDYLYEAKSIPLEPGNRPEAETEPLVSIAES